ncbi:unnamed protein product [Leptosia nina]|uniref:DNA polymerase delta subunit 3 n=1 Tax=Leptosia nina TaxID=320188 RepID=A0AAV1J7R7_9NEOP
MKTNEVNSSNLNSLKDMILDEEKLVTYLSLSKDLCIHINNSKTLLNNFIQSIRSEHPKLELNVNYLISGLVDNNQVRVSVCTEDKLEDVKKSLKVVFFIHIYSINKGRSQENTAAFVALTKYDDLTLCPGIIKSSDSVKRSNGEINNFKNSRNKAIEDTKPNLLQKNVSKAGSAKTSKSEISAPVKSELKLEKEIKKEVISPPKEQNKNDTSRNNKGIAGFFNKQNGNPRKEKKVAPPLKTIAPKVEEDDSQKMDVDIDDVEAEVKKDKRVNLNRNKVSNQIKANSKVDKKRKRVCQISDSDSEEENDPFVADHKNLNLPESDDEIPPTPAVSTLKITTGIVNPRKKRKVVDKTYMSDDGYIITKREEVYESCSDTESNTEVKPEKQEIKEEKSKQSNKIKSSPQAKKKVSPPQKGKQATLMNFFKKK